MKYIRILIACLALLAAHGHAADAEEQASPEKLQYLAEIKSIVESLNQQRGDVALEGGVAELQVPDNFYYLNPEDSEKVLVQLWGNLPGTGTNSLGMLLPSELTPLDDNSWAVTIEYQEDGYVSDENADEINYDELLVQMKQDAVETSELIVKEGYDPYELIGWASKPFYDKEAHKLHWAKEIKFGGQDENTLNYNIRVLGRKGVLVLNFIAGMDQKQLIDSQLDNVLAIAEFNQGSRYEDFDPSMDQVAAYGIGALVAGKVIAKTGLLVGLLLFLKKFWVILLIGGGAILKRFFKKKEQ